MTSTIRRISMRNRGQRGVFDLNGNLIRGRMKSRTAKSLIKKWAKLHHQELVENWETARKAGEIQKIDPLD